MKISIFADRRYQAFTPAHISFLWQERTYCECLLKYYAYGTLLPKVGMVRTGFKVEDARLAPVTPILLLEGGDYDLDVGL